MSATILCIDDDPDIGDLLIEILADAGYTVRVAADGKAGLSSALRYPPDLILLDLLLPEMGGMEVRRHLLLYEHTASIPVVLITAVANSRQWEEDMKAQGRIDKPWSNTALITLIAELIGPAVVEETE